ncbi:hypothetical protein [Actibacterium pelagium]|uniref:Uncharacterized protein n=1 Tax=Actibacterium pelagium TaxID=2029103 RepID=A0A917ABP5_9RHOB|nr:hypothetical protein [Actibacterium pelagium]GGE39021.1 hypothetical protein GCM10011517_03480 [Actibacterium pelagium]
MTSLPKLYFRIRDNGAAVFRVDTENRFRRIEMDQIAIANHRNGEIKVHNGRTLTDDERAQIEDWIATRQNLLKSRAMDEVLRTVDHLNQTTQWAQSKASDEELEEITDALMMAMHDLRSTLVKKKADRLDQT